MTLAFLCNISLLALSQGPVKYNRVLKASSQEIHVCIFCFESNVWRVFWAVTCLSDYSSFCCKESLLWQREQLAEDYTVLLPYIAGHEELITILMLSRSDRLWLMGSCAGGAHLKERQGKWAPLAPLAQLGSMCVLKHGNCHRSLFSPALHSSEICRPLIASLLNASTLSFTQTHSQWPWCVSVWPLKRWAKSNICDRSSYCW